MNLEGLSLFIQTADSGSITKAAANLDISTAAASAALKRLEKQLGATLFIRSTRHLRITEEGERYLVHARNALESLRLGQESMQSLKGEISGKLRISVPSDLGRNLLMHCFDRITDQHPKLSVNLILGDSITDFFIDRVDLAIRYGTLEDSSSVAFKLADLERVLCAAPSYLAKHGMPRTPEELHNHNCLCFQLNNRIYNQWEFSQTAKADTKKIIVKVSGNRTANDGELVRRWLVNGKGIGYKSKFDIAEDLKDGKLVRLLPNYKTATTELNLICPNKNRITPSVLLIRDLLREDFIKL
ncbi:LysR family transcriptional regulator [Sessilibacter corallicola]|uniref:LysR family transcriptional regulator n=1 Tax=Sessilibacter corallicola TaxID=2904075 RepID=A0ABQ0A692_9GAMM